MQLNRDDIIEHEDHEVHSLGQEQFPFQQWKILNSWGIKTFVLAYASD